MPSKNSENESADLLISQILTRTKISENVLMLQKEDDYIRLVTSIGNNTNLNIFNDIIDDIPNYFKNPDHFITKYGEHFKTGGNQAHFIIKKGINEQYFAIKVYRPINAHLIIHSIAIELARAFVQLIQSIVPLQFSLKFPIIYSIIPIMKGEKQIATVLITEWIDGNMFTISNPVLFKEFRTTVKKLSELGFIIDMLPNNWILNDNEMSYIDLMLFTPNSSIKERISHWIEIMGISE